jgi:hypothetical protein
MPMPHQRTATASARATGASRTTGGVLLSLLLGVTASLFTSGCGLLPPDRYTIRVDSLTVTPGAHTPTRRCGSRRPPHRFAK